MDISNIFINDISLLENWVTPEYANAHFREVFRDHTREDIFVCLTEESVEICKFYYPNATIVVNGVFSPERSLIYFV